MQWPRRRNRLQYWRKIRWYSQKELAQKVGVTNAMISHWERDEGHPPQQYALALARVLRVPVQELWPFEGYHTPQFRTGNKRKRPE